MQGTVVEWTVRPISRQSSNIEHLTRQVEELRAKRDAVDLQVKSVQEEAPEDTDPGVHRWLSEVDKVIREKETSFSEETVAAQAGSCNGWLPNLKCRYSLGRKAKQMSEEVDDLLAADFRRIVIPAPPPPPEVEFEPTEDEKQNSDSNLRESSFRDVMEALKDDECYLVNICGMAGVGKTTLMGQVVQKAREEGLFDEYTKAVSNEYPVLNLSLIQDELAKYLGLRFSSKAIGDTRASQLRQRLSSNRKILVMLDNVPEIYRLSHFLWKIGIPASCKILVTSRSLYSFYEERRGKNIVIGVLSESAAWSLFKKIAGSPIESDPELPAIAEKVLKKCAGLPLAISTVGNALKGQSIVTWRNALKEMERASRENVPVVKEDVYKRIKFSYECLEGEVDKLCLLLCSIFEEKADTSIEDLVRYGLGLGLLEHIEAMGIARSGVYTLVRSLKRRFLLLDSDKEVCVRMHDVVRDAALHMASDGVEKVIVVRNKAETMKLMGWPEAS